jgi:hypothetical protein
VDSDQSQGLSALGVEIARQHARDRENRAEMLQSASQLKYKLLIGPTDLRPLRILATQDFAWLGWRVCFHVLGVSHAVSFSSAERQVTELLTCSTVEPDREPSLTLSAERPGESCASIGGLVCRVRLQPFSLETGDHLEGDYSVTERLDVTFTGASAEVSPVTRIGWRVSGRALTVETVHSYPEEGRGVRSWSRFETAEEKA